MRIFYFSFFVLVVLVFLCFPFLNNGLVFDDEPFFRVGAPAALLERGFSFYPRIWVYDSLAINFVYFSDKILWLRVGNLFFHFSTAVVLFGFVRDLLGRLDFNRISSVSVDVSAFFVAFLFSVHPIAIMTQGYLIQRTIVCATLFALLALWTFWRGLEGNRWGVWVSCLCVLLSLYAKEHAVMLPALCFLLWVLHKRSRLNLAAGDKEVFFALLIQCAISVSVVLWSKGVIGQTYEILSDELLGEETIQPNGSLYLLSLLNQMALFFKYFSVLVLPQGSTMGLDLRVPFPLSYGVWWIWAGLAAFVSYGVISFLLLMRGGSKGLLGFALLFSWVFFATELVTVRLQEPFVLYRSYLWVPGFFIALALIIRRLKRIYSFALVPVFGLYFFGLSYDRLMSLSAPFFVWNEAAQYLESQNGQPGVFGGYRIYYNLGTTYLDAGFVDQAIVNLDKSIVLKPDYAYAHHQRGRALFLKNELEASRLEYERAISLKPDYLKAYLGMAETLRYLGRSGEAKRYLEIGCSKGSQLACERLHPTKPLVLAPKS